MATSVCVCGGGGGKSYDGALLHNAEINYRFQEI